MVMLDIGEALDELDPVDKPANKKGQKCNKLLFGSHSA